MLALVTGIIQSLGTHWGVFRHYWVLIKLAITALATLVLFVHMQPIEYVAGLAQQGSLASTDVHALRVRLVVDAAAALVVLIVTTVLGVYKPKGLTPYGWRKRHELPSAQDAQRA